MSSDNQKSKNANMEEKNKDLPDNASKTITLRGASLRVVENMEESLSVPTATSYRTIPVKLLEENRRIINEYLDEDGQNRISFTHLISWAIVCALKDHPGINSYFFRETDLPQRRFQDSVNLGIAVDRTRKDGTRTLLVPNIKNVERMTFSEFLSSYNNVIGNIRNSTFTPSDFQNTTVTLTNPGTVKLHVDPESSSRGSR